MTLVIDEKGRGVFSKETLIRFSEEGRTNVHSNLMEDGRAQAVNSPFSIIIPPVTTPPTYLFTVNVNFVPTVQVETVPCTANWNLGNLMPKKFRNAPVLMGYLTGISEVVNQIDCKVSNLSSLVNIDTCPSKYLGHLAALIAYTPKNIAAATIEQIRNQIKMAVSLYQIKGTYKVIPPLFNLFGLDVEVWDMWTQDYINFWRVAPHWHQGITDGYVPTPVNTLDSGKTFDANPVVHLDTADGFKTPHMDFVILMDRIIVQYGVYNRLFIASLWDPIFAMIEEFVGLNIVPNYYLSLAGTSDITKDVYTSPGGVMACVTDAFNAGRFSEMTVFKVGIGNVYNPPDPGVTGLQAPVYTGTCTV